MRSPDSMASVECGLPGGCGGMPFDFATLRYATLRTNGVFVLCLVKEPVLSLVEGPILSPVDGPVLSPVDGPVLSPSMGSGRTWACSPACSSSANTSSLCWSSSGAARYTRMGVRDRRMGKPGAR